MNKKEYAELMEKLHELNTMLEICRGYTQADMPDMKAFDIVLYKLKCEYMSIYEKLLTVEV